MHTHNETYNGKQITICRAKRNGFRDTFPIFIDGVYIEQEIFYSFPFSVKYARKAIDKVASMQQTTNSTSTTNHNSLTLQKEG